MNISHNDLYSTAQSQLTMSASSQEGTATSSQPTILDLFQKQRKWPNSDQQSQLIDKLNTEMTITGNQPFTIVSDTGFKRLMGATTPQYSLKSERYYCTEMLPKVIKNIVEKVKSLIHPENAGHAFSFTTDCWSGSTESLMSLCVNSLTMHGTESRLF